MMHHISFCTFYYYIVNHRLINRFIITSKLFIFIRIIEKITTIFVSSFPTERMPRGGRRPGAGRKSDAQREIVAAESARKRQRIDIGRANPNTPTIQINQQSVNEHSELFMVFEITFSP